MKRNWKKAALLAAAVGGGLAAIFALLLVPHHAVFADIQNAEEMTAVATASGLPTESLPIIIARVIQVALGVLGIIVVLMLIYCGWLYMTANGVAEKITKAQKIFRNLAIGLLLIFGSFALTTFILNKLLEAAGLSGGTSVISTNYSEPLSASLGSGIIENHYPSRDAVDIPRNTRIMITFKEAIDMESIIKDYGVTVDAGSTTFNLNTANILIYKTNDIDEESDVTADDVALASTDITVSFNNIDYLEDGTVDPASYVRAKTEGSTTFVFDPVPALGNSEEDTNYTIYLNPAIEKANGSDAFTGSYDSGYQWSFTVSTVFDLTPPHVVSVIPVASGSVEYPMNSIIQINFNEAMDPVAGTGTYHRSTGDDDPAKTFTNINAVDVNADPDEIVEGAYSISNSYKTIEFVSEDACGHDPCGNTIYCLPASADITVTGKAASLSSDPPQASTTGGLFNGLADAAGNSLDGSGPGGVYDGVASGPTGDNYVWRFLTSAVSDLTPPKIESISPSPTANSEIDVNQDLVISFDTAMWSATLNSDNVQIVPNHKQGLWYLTNNSTPTGGKTTATTSHATFWSTEVNEDLSETIYFYYPVITQGVRGSNQICMYPAIGPGCTASSPYCCNGVSSTTACRTMGATGDAAKASTILGQ